MLGSHRLDNVKSFFLAESRLRRGIGEADNVLIQRWLGPRCITIESGKPMI